MDPVLRILIVEDSEDDALLLIRKIKQGGFQPDWIRVDNEEDVKKYLHEKEWDLVISDYSMPAFNGLEALKLFKQMSLDIPFIIVSGTIGEEVAVAAMKAGAHDYVMKDHLERLLPAIRRELSETEIRRERANAIKLLEEREKFLATVVENIPHMIFIKDAKDLRFLRFNRAGEELLGYTRNELIGKNDYDFFPKHEADFFTQKDRETLKNGKLFDIPEESVQTKYKGERILHTTKIPVLNEEGIPVFLFGISEDITEKKRKEAQEIDLRNQLRQAQKMESIGTLAGGIAHDFNNILAAIIGYVELSKLDINNREKISKNLDEILKAGIRARDLVNQILIFSRQTDIKKEPMEITSLIKETLKFLRASLPMTIDIRQKLMKSNSMVIADPTQIYQIIMNLCTNAAHAMKEKGGVVDIQLTEVALKDEAELAFGGLERGQYLQLTVADTGIGIPMEIIDRIFDPFFTTKERGEGTGMGLSVVHGIVKDMGGAISVTSQPGQGTVFNILFPKYNGKTVVNYPSHLSPKTGNGTVLLVDDEETVVNSCRGILENLGYQVVSTSSPFEALEIFRTRSSEFDLVLTDMTMPQMTGLELSEQLLQIKPDIPIVLCTGFGPGITKEKLGNSGIKEMVMKPMITGELAGAVYSALHPKKELHD